MIMASPPQIPLIWILEYAVSNLTIFKNEFIEGKILSTSSHELNWEALLDQIASVPDQPPLSPIVLIALLRRVFDNPNSLDACTVDQDVDQTIYYFEQLEKLRKKRVKALQKRGGQMVAVFLKNAQSTENRFNFALQGIKIWVCCHLID